MDGALDCGVATIVSSTVPRKASNRIKAVPAPLRRWRRWLVYGLLTGVGLALGFLLPYVWVLDREVRERFEQLEWQVPTRVYARPLVLTPGLRMSPEALELELRAAAYLADGEGKLPGTYVRDGSRFIIATRAFADLDGPQPGRRLEVVLATGRVAALRDLAQHRPLPQARLDPARIATLYGSKQEERRLVRLEDLPPLLITGLQAVEDRDFKHHRGVDPIGIARALWVNLREGEVRQGGSTLTQQLVRSLFLSREQTAARKFNEALHALIIEARFDKRRILEAYLNQVYLGQQGGQAIHGVAAAAEFWFGRDVRALRTQEIALLIGLIQGPSYHDPRRYPERAIRRRNLVIDAFAETGLVDAAEQQRAKAAPLGVTPRPGVAANRHPAFMDLVREQLARDYPAEALRGAGLSIHTTLAPSAQHFAEAAVKDTLASLASKHRPELQAGLVVTDTRSGEVMAVVGNRLVDQHGFNRALEARRPVGSLLKPFVYMLALAQPGRYSLATPVEDAPIQVRLANGRHWMPENSDGRSHGRVWLREALAKSYNQATVRVGLDVGVERLAQLLQVLGGVKAQPNPSLILGSVDLSPLAVAQLYQFLASGGQIQPLRAVRGVLDAEGRPLKRYDVDIAPAQRGDAIAAQLVALGLQEAVTSGTGRQLLADGLGHLQAAGKTGTSNDSRDSWFAGYTGSHLAVVWVGNDRNEATGLYGATGAMRVWSALFRKLPSAPLQVDGEGLEWAWVDREEFATTENDCPGALRVAFVAGYLPPYHRGCTVDRLRDWLGFGERNR